MWPPAVQLQPRSRAALPGAAQQHPEQSKEHAGGGEVSMQSQALRDMTRIYLKEAIGCPIISSSMNHRDFKHFKLVDEPSW